MQSAEPAPIKFGIRNGNLEVRKETRAWFTGSGEAVWSIGQEHVGSVDK